MRRVARFNGRLVLCAALLFALVGVFAFDEPLANRMFGCVVFLLLAYIAWRNVRWGRGKA
ncbi:MAG: hypothetical protein WD875_17995 [Pirellulales bacterium]